MIVLSGVYVGCYALPKKTFQVARQAKVGLIIQVKKNQEKLLRQCKGIVKREELVGEYEEDEMGRNRLEKRRTCVYEYPSDKSWGKYVKMVITVEREVGKIDRKEKKIVKSREIAYYLSNYV